MKTNKLEGSKSAATRRDRRVERVSLGRMAVHELAEEELSFFCCICRCSMSPAEAAVGMEAVCVECLSSSGRYQ